MQVANFFPGFTRGRLFGLGRVGIQSSLSDDLGTRGGDGSSITGIMIWEGTQACMPDRSPRLRGRVSAHLCRIETRRTGPREGESSFWGAGRGRHTDLQVCRP